MTKEDAVKMAESGWWKHLEPRQIAEFQLNERLLCMPFGDFQEAVEKALGRPVWTHEFAHPESLISELMGDRKAPTMAEILDLIPSDKRVVIACT